MTSFLPRLALSSALVASLACGAGCSEVSLAASDVVFEVTGNADVDGKDPIPVTVVGRLKVDAQADVTGVVAFTSGGYPVHVHGTASGDTIHLDAVTLFSTFTGGSDSFHLEGLDLQIDRDDAGAVVAVSLEGSGTLDSLGGDVVSTWDASLSLDGGPDRTAPGVEVVEAVRGFPVNPIEPLHVRFTEPVERDAILGALQVKAGDGSDVEIAVTTPDVVDGVVTWATVTPVKAWPFGSALSVQPGGKLVDLGGNAWAKAEAVMAPTKPQGAVGATSFESGAAPEFVTSTGAASVQELPAPLTEDGTHALVVGETGAWASLAVPVGAKTMRLRIAYVVQGFGPAESVGEWLGWGISVVGAGKRVEATRDMTGVTFTEAGGDGISNMLGPIETVELDVHEMAGTTAVLAMTSASVSMPPVSVMGLLVVDRIEL